MRLLMFWGSAGRRFEIKNLRLKSQNDWSEEWGSQTNVAIPGQTRPDSSNRLKQDLIPEYISGDLPQEGRRVTSRFEQSLQKQVP